MTNQKTFHTDFFSNEYICDSCGRRFPAYYKLRDSSKRKQFGRRLVSGLNNFYRHLFSCNAQKG